MTVTTGRIGVEPVVIDTMIAGALVSRQPLARLYETHISGRNLVVSFVTLAELRFGALHKGWGEPRKQRMEARLASMTIVGANSDLATTCARLRQACSAAGVGLHEKIHEADRWIAATALQFGLPLVSHDKIFDNVPGLTNIRLP